MPTEIYKTNHIYTIDGIEIEIIPLKIKYLKQLMVKFEDVRESKNEQQTIAILAECVRIAMKQYYPEISKKIEDVEDSFDLNTIYKILRFSAGIRINEDEEDATEQVKEGGESANWEELDLASLEAEVFTLGIWKNFDELERSISVEELMKILSTSRELNYDEKKFLAALKGIDLDAESGQDRGQKEWEDMKARVFSGGATNDSNDVLALQGQNAIKAGFGIGMGLSYEDSRDPNVLITKD